MPKVALGKLPSDLWEKGLPKALFAMPEPNRAAMGRRGRDWVRTHFTAELAAQQIVDFYRAIAR